ncbi:MAG TPA: SDR family oxidoreductase [Vicinamibacteria bacterium]|nr:SDR family oxidoreductase [Vicinamibacteria bacterium]
MFSLTNKVAVVTGGGSGIGEAIALLFAKQGARVSVLDVDEAAARQAAERIVREGGQADAQRCDVSSAADTVAAMAAVEKSAGRIDILANIAGVVHIGTVETTAEADFDRVYRVNVKGMYLSTQAALPIILKGGGGVILNMASIASLIGIPERFAYSTSKGAVLSMTRSIATDYMNKNVRCNCICPARVHTPLVDGYLRSTYPGREQEMFQQLSAYQPLGRMGTPEEVAQMALYLCSDEASFITGQAFPIDGGVLVS